MLANLVRILANRSKSGTHVKNSMFVSISNGLKDKICVQYNANGSCGDIKKEGTSSDIRDVKESAPNTTNNTSIAEMV